MTVLFVAWNTPPRRGGVEQMVWNLFRHLSSSDTVTLLAGRAPGEFPDPKGVHRAPLPGVIGFLIWLIWRVPFELLRRRQDVVLSSGALVGSVVQLLSRVRRLPHATLVYGTDLSYANRWYQRWLRFALPGVSLCLAISRAAEREAVSRRFVPDSKVGLLHPGVDPAMAHLPAPSQIPRPAAPVLLFVGRVIPRKGLGPFIERCLPAILAKREVEFWVVGGEPRQSLAHEPGELSRIKQTVGGTPMGERIRFLGEVSDAELRAVYRRAKLLVLPAVAVPGDVEGFGIVFLEAALFGVPAVATRLGGIPEAVVDGETGLLTEAGDWDAFASSVLTLLEDHELCARLADNAKRRAVEEHDWRRVAERCRAALAGIVER